MIPRDPWRALFEVLATRWSSTRLAIFGSDGLAYILPPADIVRVHGRRQPLERGVHGICGCCPRI